MPPPWQQSVKIRAEGQLPDADADLEVPQGVLRKVVERQVAEMSMGVRTTWICLAPILGVQRTAGLGTILGAVDGSSK